MNVFTLGAGTVKVLHAGALTEDGVCNFRQLSGNVEGEGAEALDIDAAAGAELRIEVRDQRTPHNEHLGLGLEGLLVANGALGGRVVLAWVVMAILEDPKRVASN